MKQIPLTKIGFFNPGRLTDEEIEQSFISRIPFFEYLFKKIIEEPANSIPQHYLVIGQRGMGKTSLLVRIAAELRKSPYNKTFIPLSFPEEQYNIDRLSKFWLNCLDALADALDKENNKTELFALDAEISSLTKENNIEANAVYDKFMKWTKVIGRRAVLLVDNLNLIFEKISKEEQHQLRAILISNDAPILVGASATSIDETLDYGAPFYDGFQISYLKKLSFQESLDVLKNLARITGNKDFENNYLNQKGRLEALYQLTGGTPRTLAILFPLIQNGFSESIQTDLDALLDAITPLYKARFEELSPQLQVVMDAVALHWDPINLEQLRTITQLENSQLSPQLKRLIDVGWLLKLDAYKAKGGAYELSERFFNVWYLMRRSSRRQKRELYCLTKFLETFYGDGIHEIAKNRMTCKSESISHITFDLALAEAVVGSKISYKLKDKSYKALVDLSLTDDAILKNFSIPKNITQQKIVDLINEANSFYDKKQFYDAELSLLKVFKLDEDTNVWALLGHLYHYKLERPLEAEVAYKKAIAIEERDSDTWGSLGNLYQYEFENFTEAEYAYQKAIAIDKTDADTWGNLGHLYHYHFKRITEAELAYKKSIAIDEEDDSTWNDLGNLYQYELESFAEAENAYKKAIAIDGNEQRFLINLGDLYARSLKEYEKAESTYMKSIAINEKDIFSWTGLGDLYQYRMRKYVEAENAYKKAIALDETIPYMWNRLGDLYQFFMGKYSDAEISYKRSIALDEKNSASWYGLGLLYQDHFNDYRKAEIAYRNAIIINEKNSFVWDGLGNLYQDFIGDNFNAEIAYRKAIGLDPTNIYPIYNLVFLLRDKMNKVDEAKELFSTIKLSGEVRDSYFLNEALFALHDKNLGVAKANIRNALSEIDDTLPSNTQSDWYRCAAIAIKLGYGHILLNVLSEKSYDILMRPFYIAIEALTKKEEELFLNSVAAEVREPAKKIMEIMKNYMK